MLTSPHPLPNVIPWAVSRSRSTAFKRAVMQHPVRVGSRLLCLVGPDSLQAR
ncbi:hypothetical protein C4K26_3583 [Pseudomonas chlororaphis]|nr:hypothetical protein C4K26_3583 [Pseudomonas chlororaphis]